MHQPEALGSYLRLGVVIQSETVHSVYQLVGQGREPSEHPLQTTVPRCTEFLGSTTRIPRNRVVRGLAELPYVFLQVSDDLGDRTKLRRHSLGTIPSVHMLGAE